MTTDTTDDQELARALAGMNSELAQVAEPAAGALAFEETAAPAPEPQPVVPAPTPVAAPTPDPAPAAPVADESAPVVDAPAPAAPAAGDNDLDSIKKDALDALRPLVDKLTVPADEKFDTYLLLLRSTDDKTLIAPAHAAAKDIPDEARRAQALLDVIKEIDYLNNKG